MFEDTRPYNDSEVPAAIARVAHDPRFAIIVGYLFPGANVEQYRQQFLQIKTVDEFQHQVMLKAINSIINQTSTGLTSNGFQLLDNDHRYLFLANHRDILLDAAILQILLDKHQLRTSEITFGSNLMKGELVIDIGKLNKMFRIVRGGTARDFYHNSMEVSSYMRYTIHQKGESVWIAQRNGRTKDGNDKTDPAVLKMFSMSSDKNFVDNLEEMRITPVAISYEYEPCDFRKTQELYISQYQQYIKESDEDLQSILHGITQPKGRIHLETTPPITREELEICNQQEKKNKFIHLAQLIDQRIYHSYHLWPTHFIAHDLLNEAPTFRDRYTDEERNTFIIYMNEGLSRLQGDASELQQIFLSIYANPVEHCL